jgi:hypothetical protein
MFHVTEGHQGVVAVTLEEVLGLLQKDDKAVLKLDCEGAEYDIIYNASEESIQRFETIFLEVHNDLVPQYINGGAELVEYVTNLGYICYKLPFASGIWYPDGTFVKTNNEFYKFKRNI